MAAHLRRGGSVYFFIVSAFDECMGFLKYEHRRKFFVVEFAISLCRLKDNASDYSYNSVEYV
jgi:hypothetical protein